MAGQPASQMVTQRATSGNPRINSRSKYVLITSLKRILLEKTLLSSISAAPPLFNATYLSRLFDPPLGRYASRIPILMYNTRVLAFPS
jgi:hypothetical protein